MTHFPLFFNLKDKDIIIFGGGHHALQKIKKLKPFEPRLTVISECISDDIKNTGGITFKEQKFCKSDLDINPLFVIIAEDEKTTAEIYAECNHRHIPVNAVDRLEYCDIIFPSVTASENLCIGISSGGLSPTATVEFKERFENQIPENTDEIIEWMPSVKAYVKQTVNASTQKQALREIFKEAIDKNRTLEKYETDGIIKKFL